MRVRFVPELYRPDATASGTLNDVVQLVAEFDESVANEIRLDERIGDDAPVADLVSSLRSLGYDDAGNPGTPVFPDSG